MCYHYNKYVVICFICILQSTPNNHLFSSYYIFREYINICITAINSIELNCNTFLIDFILQYNKLHVFHNIDLSYSCFLLKYVTSINVLYVMLITYIILDITYVIILNS